MSVARVCAGRPGQELDRLCRRLAFLHLVANPHALALPEVGLEGQTMRDADDRPVIELDHLAVHVDDAALGRRGGRKPPLTL